ncbi:MAG: hypothetical protein MUF87_01015 [Anaerolineae bacterium]|nr:hypothetical protein [Anaerolineae bacterium]
MSKYLLSAGVFVIGLALLSLTGWWWPGILFLFGATAFTYTLAERRRWYEAQWALCFIGIGIIFWSGPSLPLILIILIGGIIFWIWASWHLFDDEEDYEYQQPDIRIKREDRVDDDAKQ